jgi:hypothetical protein
MSEDRKAVATRERDRYAIEAADARSHLRGRMGAAVRADLVARMDECERQRDRWQAELDRLGQ